MDKQEYMPYLGRMRKTNENRKEEMMDIKPAYGFIPEWTFGDRLRKARDVMGLDRSEFAALGEPGDFTFKTIANYENGLTTPKTFVVRALAQMAGVDYDWLLTGKTPTGTGPDGGVPSNVTKLPGLDSNQEPIGGRHNRNQHSTSIQTRGNLKDDLQKAA